MDWELFYSSFRKPDFIAGYEIQNRLGGGAFGDVYKARKVSIDKHYAIKFLKIDEPASRSAVERELEQVRHFAAIDHPNLVTVEDMGVVLDVPYLVMGYAGEDTLARRLRRERPSSEKALLYFVQICRGVSALHERRLAHFDLKPSNVFLKGDVARVGDYGLAKLMIDGRQTLSFGRGTPHYMAPEMLKNRADLRADVYSLGVILFELLTGRLPFEPSEEAGVVLREDDGPPSFPADFSPLVAPAVARCLRLNPADRFQSVAELLAAMGQTARAGDPLLPLSQGIAGTAASGASSKPPSTAVPKGSSSHPREAGREIRAAATELTRGAVEVARGVWDGLRTPRGTPAEAPRALPPPPVATPPVTGSPSDVLAIHTLEDASLQARPASAHVARAAFVTRSREIALEGVPGAVPVPPRAAGGPLRAIGATLRLGLEVLVALVTGPLLRALGSFGRAGDRLLSGSRGLFVGIVRLAVFLLFMLALGAALMFALVWVGQS
jgi:serine/threonine-protein kinase PpkA